MTGKIDESNKAVYVAFEDTVERLSKVDREFSAELGDFRSTSET